MFGFGYRQFKKGSARWMLTRHFAPLDLQKLAISERVFPLRVRVDVQRAMESAFAGRTVQCCGVHSMMMHMGVTLAGIVADVAWQTRTVPAQYEEVDIGEEQPIRCMQNALWLLGEQGARHAVLMAPAEQYGRASGLRIQVAAEGGEASFRFADQLFGQLEKAVTKGAAYRGKVLSLEQTESYSGEASGIRVHRLRGVDREQVILPRKTLELLERNVVGFVRNRERLVKYGRSAKKGILFYGPPGTGKTHTIHYLAGALSGHTTLLISAEQVGLLAEYMTLARLLQPSIVVIEDADLIARDRSQMGSVCEEVLLNKLLNEMDGLKEDAEILFVLTTNRPGALEAALSARPGRVDQAIEFPLPDDEGRAKLVQLYSQGVELLDGVLAATVRRTQGVSAAFIRELMRRSVQFNLERANDGKINMADVEAAMEEMVFSGGALNRKLLGGNWAEDEVAGMEQDGISPTVALPR